MNELPYIEKWLFTTLKNDATLDPLIADRVYGYRPPTGATFPVIVFNFQAGRDIQGNGVHRNMTRPLYQIKAIVRGSLSTAQRDIANRVDDIVQNIESVAFEGFIFSARREQPIAYAEQGDDAEQRFFHLGGIYRIDTQTA